MKAAFITVIIITASFTVLSGETGSDEISDMPVSNTPGGIDSSSNSDITFNANLYNIEKLSSVNTVLNPGGILNNYNSYLAGGLSGELMYYLYFRWKTDSLSYQASDIGYYYVATNNEQLTNLLTENYISWHLGSLFADAGKKKITQSVCFLTTPMDFALYSYNDISKSKSYNLQFSEGKYMANFDWFSDFGAIGFSYIPEIDFTSNILEYFSSSQIQQEELRYTADFGGVDLGLALSYDNIWRAGANITTTIGDYIELHAEAAYLENDPRFSFVTNMEITGGNEYGPIYSPLLASTQFFISNVCQIIIGGTYNAEVFSLYIEYYYNMDGYDYSDWANIRNVMKNYRADYDNQPAGPVSVANLGTLMSMLGNTSYLNICQDYAMVRVTTPPTSSDSLSLGWTTLLNLEDFSGMEIFSASYGWDHMSLTGQFSFGFGDQYSEFMLLGQNWALEIDIVLSI
ncbi:MAG: hypothetical protein ABSG94_12615 [Brevinematales bacterium]|jgi:hypothetical protein